VNKIVNEVFTGIYEWSELSCFGNGKIIYDLLNQESETNNESKSKE